MTRQVTHTAVGPEAGQDTGQDSQVLNFNFAEGDQMVSFGIQGNESYAASEDESDPEEENEANCESQQMPPDSEEGASSAEGSRMPQPPTRTGRKQLKEKQKQSDGHVVKIKQIDDEMANKLYQLHDLMEEGGLVESAEILRKSSGVKPLPKNQREIQEGRQTLNVNNNKNTVRPVQIINNESEDTIYTQAVKDRLSSSTGEVDTSNECIDPLVGETIGRNQPGGPDLGLIRDVRHNLRISSVVGARNDQGEPTPGPSGEQNGHGGQRGPPRDVNPNQWAKNMIIALEASKARMIKTPGEYAIDFSKDMVHSVMVDEMYSVVAAHVDEVTYDKIIQGKYVDFSKLIPKDKIADEEEDILQLVQRNGQTYYTSVKEGTVINSFNR